MPFYLLMRQAGEGCDYTIGCGRFFKKLTAKNKEDAVDEAKVIFDDHGIPGSRDLKEAFLLHVTVEDDLQELLQELREERLRATDQRSNTAKRIQLEKLKKELGET